MRLCNWAQEIYPLIRAKPEISDFCNLGDNKLCDGRVFCTNLGVCFSVGDDFVNVWLSKKCLFARNIDLRNYWHLF